MATGKIGRPRSVDEPTVISASIKRQDYDRLCQLTPKGASLSSTVRKVIARGLRGAHADVRRVT